MKFVESFEVKIVLLFQILDENLKNLKQQNLEDKTFDSPVKQNLVLQNPKSYLEVAKQRIWDLLENYEIKSSKIKSIKDDENLIEVLEEMKKKGKLGKNREIKKILITSFLKYSKLQSPAQSQKITDLTDKIIKIFLLKKEKFSAEFVFQALNNNETSPKFSIFEV